MPGTLYIVGEIVGCGNAIAMLDGFARRSTSILLGQDIVGAVGLFRSHAGEIEVTVDGDELFLIPLDNLLGIVTQEEAGSGEAKVQEAQEVGAKGRRTRRGAYIVRD